MPERIQRKRTKGWRMPEGAVYVGRPSRWGNPFEVGGYLRMEAYLAGEVGAAERAGCRINWPADAVAAFSWWVRVKNLTPAIRQDLAGRDLACWCPLDQPCHADVLLEVANG